MILAEAAAHAFVAEGVKNAGGVSTREVRHEGMGSAMADGSARVSGHVGVCYVTRGPGVTQLAASLAAMPVRRSVAG